MQFYRILKVAHLSLVFAVAATSFLMMASGEAQAECKFFTGFADNKDGTVTDTRTGLVWKRCAEGYDWANGACAGKGVTAAWDDAKTMAKQSRFLDKSDWRLPTKEEFESVLGTLHDCIPNKKGEFAASKAIAHVGVEFWSSSPNENSSAWEVNFLNGYVNANFRSFGRYVRLVRDSQLVGGKASLEFINEPAEKSARNQRAAQQAAQQAANQRAADEARQRKEAQDREIKVAAFRKSIKEGDDTSVGVVIEVKGNLVKIQTNDSQCSQRDYDNNCKNWINTPAEKWFKRSEVYPQ